MHRLYFLILCSAISLAAYGDEALITDRRGQIAGSIEPSANGVTIYDRRGKLVGEVTSEGQILDRRGRISGTIDDGEEDIPDYAPEANVP